jgi:hypothetical protein
MTGRRNPGHTNGPRAPPAGFEPAVSRSTGGRALLAALRRHEKTGAGTIAAKGSSDPRRGERISRVHVWPVSAGVDDRKRNRADRQQQKRDAGGQKDFAARWPGAPVGRMPDRPLFALRSLALWSSRARMIAAHGFHSGFAALPPVHRTPGGVAGSGRLRRPLPPEKPLCAGPLARSALPAGSGTPPRLAAGLCADGGRRRAVPGNCDTFGHAVLLPGSASRSVPRETIPRR